MDKRVNKTAVSRILEVVRDEAREIQELAEQVDPGELIAVLDILRSCKGKVITTGCGTSGAAARKIAHTMNCVELPALFLAPSDALHGGMGVIQKEDIVIFFSKGGATAELEQMAESIGEKQSAMITVTENKECLLAKKSNCILTVKVAKEPDSFNMLATASTLSVISVFDAVIIALAEEQNYTRSSFLRIHPGGEVGRRLLEQVEKQG